MGEDMSVDLVTCRDSHNAAEGKRKRYSDIHPGKPA